MMQRLFEEPNQANPPVIRAPCIRGRRLTAKTDDKSRIGGWAAADRAAEGTKLEPEPAAQGQSELQKPASGTERTVSGSPQVLAPDMPGRLRSLTTRKRLSQQGLRSWKSLAVACRHPGIVVPESL